MQRKGPARRGGAEVYGITTARRKQQDDVNSRMIKYGVSMGIRMVCLVLAFVTHGPLAWVFVAGAVLLPYVAVLLANAGRETAPRAPTTLIGTGTAGRAGSTASAPPPLAIGPARTRPAASGQPGARPQGQWQHSYPPPGGTRPGSPRDDRRARAS